jgi:hypothetical protein
MKQVVRVLLNYSALQDAVTQVVESGILTLDMARCTYDSTSRDACPSVRRTLWHQ